MPDQTGSTRKKLLDIAQEMIQKRGVNAVSFQDLSDAVGIRKASVHHHFSSKAELLERLTERYVSNFEDLTETIRQSRANGKTKLKRYCYLFLETLKSGQHDKSCLCGMLMAEVSSLNQPVLKQIREFLRGNQHVLEEIIKDGIADGSLRNQTNIKSSALLVLAALEGGLLIARCNQDPKQFADLIGRIVALLAAS